MGEQDLLGSRSRASHLALRVTSAALGVLLSLSLLLLGVTAGPPPHLWSIPALIVSLVIALALLRRVLPRLTTWCSAGIWLLSGVITGGVLIGGMIAALLWASLDTEYAPGFTERAFVGIRVGDRREAVLSRLGEPLFVRANEPSRQWIYSEHLQPAFPETGTATGTHTIFTFDAGARVKHIRGAEARAPGTIVIGDGRNFLKLTDAEIERLKGESSEAVRARFGSPAAVYEDRAAEVLYYSRSPSSSSYRLRKLGLDEDGMVVQIVRSIYWD